MSVNERNDRHYRLVPSVTRNLTADILSPRQTMSQQRLVLAHMRVLRSNYQENHGPPGRFHVSENRVKSIVSSVHVGYLLFQSDAAIPRGHLFPRKHGSFVRLALKKKLASIGDQGRS